MSSAHTTANRLGREMCVQVLRTVCCDRSGRGPAAAAVHAIERGTRRVDGDAQEIPEFQGDVRGSSCQRFFMEHVHPHAVGPALLESRAFHNATMTLEIPTSL